MVQVAIFDYGAGNIFSLRNSLERAGAAVDVIDSLDGLDHAGLLLPGVGNFDPAMENMGEGAADIFRDRIRGKIPVLGICLGMEVFFERSEEGTLGGLGLVGGRVVMLPRSMKIPHMGWNSISIDGPGVLLEGVPDGSWAYFVHSYRAMPEDGGIITASSDYGMDIPAVVESGGLFGTQFHPEKSGRAGAMMIRNFLRECTR